MNEAVKPEKIRCDACPVMCYIADGRSGACDRYANAGGELVRLDPLTILENRLEDGGDVVPFLASSESEGVDSGQSRFITAVGAGTTYPDYKPAPFIVSSEVNGVDMITVVTEGIFSYCGAKVKIDTDRHLGHECSPVRVEGEQIGHVTTAEYGSQMLSLGGVNHLTGGSKKEGRVTCDALLRLCNGEPVEMTIDDGATLIVEAGKPPIVNGTQENVMRVGCGSATVGMFAAQWKGLVDEVIVVDDHITGVMSEHQAGKVIGWPETGIKINGRRSTPGRYFQVAEPGTGWGGTDLDDPLKIIGKFNPKTAWPGLSILMVSTTGEHAAYYELNEDLEPVEKDMPPRLKPSAERIAENCEPAMTSVLFMAGAGGSLRAGTTENPIGLTRSVQAAITTVTSGGAPVFVWPGGGITFMVDVTRMPKNSFGHVPTPALVAPIEFTMRAEDYRALGGHMDYVMPLQDAVNGVRAKQNDHILSGARSVGSKKGNPWPLS
ncbi:6-hydroxynicotinate reductase [Rhizobium sp. L1K21]|uniref:6-hydroxynicotinate reductase n=1 Tax=Rhizobium sp. L1K21 TaxID=2954933 RepID=UPI0020929AC6|nr:6-hydroxynicotinate reductase [Rhizobium sp. L1K21]MCO6188354.1 6-hydroxynicotinate reductase [Rhizobium sp. L1K21]